MGVNTRGNMNGEKATGSSGNPSAQILTGKQEHYLKRELVGTQVSSEIVELNSPTALRRFGAPFKSDFGEIAPVDSELPILRYIFVNHVRNFPFLDKAHEKEFWQDRLQVFLESFANKNISSSEDRHEETKRRKLAKKCEKVVELMMVSGIPTSSGYEERIRFSEMEVVDRGANEQGLLVNMPEGNVINGWDVNIAAVRTTAVRRTLRYHQHAEFLIRVRQQDGPSIYIGRRFGDFARLHKKLRTELPGKVIPPLPRKNKNSVSSSFFGSTLDDDASSTSSVNTLETNEGQSTRNLLVPSTLKHKASVSSFKSISSQSPRASGELQGETVTLYREEQRVSLRAFLRLILQNHRIASSNAMKEFLTDKPITLNEEEEMDIARRKELDAKRIEEQRRFYEIARKRARELDVYMEQFRQDIVERNGLTKLFQEIREKDSVETLSPQYQKFAEWLRIEVAATLYHIFLAEDNSPELFAQAKRIHSLIPYSILKNVIRIANPAAVMAGVLDLFLAQPFGARSLLQRIFAMAIQDGVKAFQKSVDSLATRIDDNILVDKLRAFTEANEEVKNELRAEAEAESVDIVVVVLRSEHFQPELTVRQIEKVFNSYVAWVSAVESIDDPEIQQGAQWFSYLKQLLKVLTRQRDKMMMLNIIEEPVTLQLFRDLFTIFYEPLVRVYKSANVYNSITDFAEFANDAIAVIERAQRQDVSADPNQTVQSFIDLCTRHQQSFYKFVHEVHIHDNGLFASLMTWLEDILKFLREGPESGGTLDMNALFQGAVSAGQIDKDAAIAEIDSLIKWHSDRKKWHQDKTRQKMAAEGVNEQMPGVSTFKSSDFGLHEADLEDLAIEDDVSDPSDENSEDDDMDPIEFERKRRSRHQDRLRRSAGEPVKPKISEILKLRDSFGSMLRMVLA
ncbi:PX domain-containing protein [Nannizzia gypsea CBS 118893]|uniref:PX domain-containing protein n=1 Tax=Arthroderma gypseum (strain ATCC MYA-4604 / CBS 118893) TaxID=535722 RepID=E4UV97_ARTGP|nr:PX domain-containing protein [Nannizzia gypsea CBS 118893]EFR02224.1 PX domain-containing protein [Nannizzia gypsea CBS 118893]